MIISLSTFIFRHMSKLILITHIVFYSLQYFFTRQIQGIINYCAEKPKYETPDWMREFHRYYSDALEHKTLTSVKQIETFLIDNPDAIVLYDYTMEFLYKIGAFSIEKFDIIGYFNMFLYEFGWLIVLYFCIQYACFTMWTWHFYQNLKNLIFLKTETFATFFNIFLIKTFYPFLCYLPFGRLVYKYKMVNVFVEDVCFAITILIIIGYIDYITGFVRIFKASIIKKEKTKTDTYVFDGFKKTKKFKFIYKPTFKKERIEIYKSVILLPVNYLTYFILPFKGRYYEVIFALGMMLLFISIIDINCGFVPELNYFEKDLSRAKHLYKEIILTMKPKP